jgi:hypothetical protein
MTSLSATCFLSRRPRRAAHRRARRSAGASRWKVAMERRCEKARSVRARVSRTGAKGGSLTRWWLLDGRSAPARPITPNLERARRRPSFVRAVFIARNDTPLIGERVATRGRSAKEGGSEPTGVKTCHPFAFQPRELDRAAGGSPPGCLRGLHGRFASALARPRRPPRCAAHRRARQRARAQRDGRW